MVPRPPTPNQVSDAVLGTLQKEYDLVNSSIRQLADIRFRLLSFLPLLGGAANYVITTAALGLQPNASKRPAVPLGLALFAGVIGFLVTVGIVMYDQRT